MKSLLLLSKKRSIWILNACLKSVKKCLINQIKWSNIFSHIFLQGTSSAATTAATRCLRWLSIWITIWLHTKPKKTFRKMFALILDARNILNISGSYGIIWKHMRMNTSFIVHTKVVIKSTILDPIWRFIYESTLGWDPFSVTFAQENSYPNGTRISICALVSVGPKINKKIKS